MAHENGYLTGSQSRSGPHLLSISLRWLSILHCRTIAYKTQARPIWTSILLTLQVVYGYSVV